jgi:site-specific recombinase XerD
METISTELEHYRRYLEGVSSSQNVVKMYYNRTRTFLGLHLEAMTLDSAALREVIDNYIDNLPVNSAKEVPAAAARHYWSYRFGKPYFEKYRQRDFPRNDSIEDEVEAYKDYLHRTGRSGGKYALQRASRIRAFLYTVFGAVVFSRENVTVDVVRTYMRDSLQRLKMSTRSLVGSELRCYARFLESQGFKRSVQPISRIPLSCSFRRQEDLPQSISEEDYRTLVASVKADSERGSRDLAMILLMGNLGLRRSDVSRLSLDDIDWNTGVITVRKSKSISARSIPLDMETGSTIELYVREFRPASDHRSLFLCAGGETGDGRAAPEVIGRAVKLAAEKAGIAAYCGTHSLRRAVATNMVAAGVDIKTVADILGHEQILTTMGYLRLDLPSLRNVASEWPKEDAHDCR